MTRVESNRQTHRFSQAEAMIESLSLAVYRSPVDPHELTSQRRKSN